MNIQIINLGDVLMSRPAGKDAFLLLELQKTVLEPIDVSKYKRN